MWKAPMLFPILLVVTVLVCSISAASVAGAGNSDQPNTRWRWPQEFPSRVGAGRLIPAARRPQQQHHQQTVRLNKGFQPVLPPQQTNNKFNGNLPNRGVVPVAGVPTTRSPIIRRPSIPVTVPPLPSPPIQVTKPINEADIEPSVETTTKNASTVPLLKDAGKPGNPYILLNDIFPPENSIRTKEEEEASLNSLQNKDLGGLEPNEVYLADDDLFVVRGFNYKKPYAADPPGAPISDYQAPAPLPPPPPEPGTVFYPSNETDQTFNFFNPDFSSTNPADLPFFPFIPGGLNGSTPPGLPPVEPPNFIPFPFLPPPPPHWTEEKEFGDNDIRDPFQPFGPQGNFPFPPGVNGQDFSLFNGSQGPPPPSGLNGFPGVPPFHGGNFQTGPLAGQQRPPGFPHSGLNGFPPGGPPNRPPGSPPPPKPAGGLPPPPVGGNTTLLDDEEDVPFTPLFPERPVEYYYPTHNTTTQPPGPFGPGIFVPPPVQFFAPRNKSEILDVEISPKLFLPPFNLPNYYKKETSTDQSGHLPPPMYLRPDEQPQHPHYDGSLNHQHDPLHQTPIYPPFPSQPYNNIPIYPAPNQTPNKKDKVIAPPSAGSEGANVFDGQYNKEISQLPPLAQIPQYQPYGPIFPPIPYQTYQPLESPGYGLRVPVQLTIPVTTPTHYSPANHHQQYQPYAPYFTNDGGGGGGGQGVSLESDININYQQPRPSIEPESEIIDPTQFQFNPNWNPYTASYVQTPISTQNYESLSQPFQRPTKDSSGSGSSGKTPASFVTVFRIGGGSYSYNLDRGR